MSDTDKRIEMKELVSRADLHYEGTVGASDEGLPIGNGRMASLVWTSPWSIKLQINRVDVYASDSTSRSFNRRNQDYSCGCAQVDIDLGHGAELFPDDQTRQHLALYEGLVTIEGNGVVVRVVSSQHSDLFGIEIDDRRRQPAPVTAKLRMLRPAEVYEKNHSAISSFERQPDHAALKQTFSEDRYYCASAVAVTATGGQVTTRLLDETGGATKKHSSEKIPGLGQSMETEISLILEPGPATRAVFLSSAATFETAVDPVAESVAIAAEAARAGFEHLVGESSDWWREFWTGSYLHLQSADGSAEIVESHYNYFLYLMACCSRGRYAPRYGCLLYSTHGDKRAWGAQQWWTNLSLYYRGLHPTGKYEILDACYSHYFGVKDSCSRAARQQWGSEGIFFPETIWFDGLESLPEEIAAEMRELYLCRQPWEARSPQFDEYASVRHPHSSRWNWIGHGRWVDGKWTYGYNAVPPFSPVNHFLASGGEIASLFWKRYEYTRDRAWLESTGYPIISGVAEFFCNFPNFRQESDGQYHVTKVNQGEHLKGVRDAFDFICAVKGVLPVAARAAEVLGVDADLRKKWLEIAANTAPLPTTENPDSVEAAKPGEPVRFTDGLKPVVDGGPRLGIDECNSRFYDHDIGSLESREAGGDLFAIADNTFSHEYTEGVDSNTSVWVMSSLPVIAAKLGRSDDFRNAVQNIIRVIDPASDFCDFEGQWERGALPNRMTNREGVNAIGAQRLGTTVYAVNEALCQSGPPEPGGIPVVRIFPAWPRDWDAEFRLMVRGGFSVAARMTAGEIPDVEIATVEKQADSELRLRNPWPGKTVTIERSQGGSEACEGDLLVVPMNQDETVSLRPS